MPLPSTSAPVVTSSASAVDVIAAAVKWIQIDPFFREARYGSVTRVEGAPTVCGWDERLREYAYAKSKTVSFPAVYASVSPVLTRMSAAITRYSWPAVKSLKDLDPTDEVQLRDDAEWICRWGGVEQRSYADTWKVIRSAVTGTAMPGAPMNSGWTKVASFATHGLPNAQTIWDSRAAISVILRIDGVIQASGLASRVMSPYRLGFGSASSSGLRDQKMKLIRSKWPAGYGSWDYHFGGSKIVREMVAILNNPSNGYPAMPLPGGGSGPWDVFGVGFVLFMDGY
jgi:hypothetical protein